MYIRIAFRALKVSYSDVGKGEVAVNCEKNTIFPEHPVFGMELRICLIVENGFFPFKSLIEFNYKDQLIKS